MCVYPKLPTLFQVEVEKFKKQLLQTTLEVHHGNRTYAARALGLQRTYLLRLMKNFQVRVARE